MHVYHISYNAEHLVIHLRGHQLYTKYQCIIYFI
jgi:hypothetical protein